LFSQIGHAPVAACSGMTLEYMIAFPATQFVVLVSLETT
jgi:hypothetical protein